MNNGNGSTALVRHETAGPAVEQRMAITPRTLNDVVLVSEMIAKTGLCGVKSTEEAFVRLTTGMELGLGMMQSLRGVYVINGKPSLYADMMVGVCLSHPDVCEYFDLVESTTEKATYATKRHGRPEQRLTFDLEDAKRAELLSNPTYKKHPKNMLRARCSANLARAIYADLLNGLYTPDELEDAHVIDRRETGAANVQKFDAVKVERTTDAEHPAIALLREFGECATSAQVNALWKSSAKIHKAMLAEDQKMLAAQVADIKQALVTREKEAEKQAATQSEPSDPDGDGR